MITFRCATHGVILTIHGDKRELRTSIRLSYPCYLLGAIDPEEGQYGPCIVERVS